MRIISGLLAGTSGDTAGRMIAEKLSIQMRQPVIFENRPGAKWSDRRKGTQAIAPDGYNLLFTASNTIGDLLANRLQVFFPAYSTIVGVLPLRKITLLGVFANQRLSQRPDLATVQEVVPDLTSVPSWFGRSARLA